MNNIKDSVLEHVEKSKNYNVLEWMLIHLSYPNNLFIHSNNSQENQQI
jgi:hypothetical protein